MNLGAAQVIQGDARHLPLDDNSVDLVVTSPPYFALRSYQDGGSHYEGQLGSEGTPAEFVAALLEVTRECMRVLKPSGSLWVNLGDKYSTGSSGDRNNGFNERSGNAPGKRAQETSQLRSAPLAGMRPKSLIGIPWRYALACIDDLGLILRAEVIWSKPNGLPESVTDRVRRSHEQWFHFTLEPRYFSAVDEIREPQTAEASGGPSKARQNGWGGFTAGQGRFHNPLGKLPGSVWSIPTQPPQVPDHLGVDHFAAFPTEWPRRIIQGWSPAGVCSECGEGRQPVVARASMERHNGGKSPIREYPAHHAGHETRTLSIRPDYRITGYVCACTLPGTSGQPAYEPPPTTPAVVLDPFGGTGTTALVAKALGRHGITIDMSADYSRLAAWRTTDRNQLARVLGVPKAAAPDTSQLDLFGEATA